MAFVLAMGIVALVALPAAAAVQISLIRDAETEDLIRTYATPVFRAARLDPSAIRIYLVRDHRINAFVAGGQNLFINTGLLVRSEGPSQVIGVIAHEAGHIAGGHLSRTQDQLSNTTAESILALVLGAAATAVGRPDVGGAVMLGGQEAAFRGLLQYSRTQEGAADSAGLSFLEKSGQSSEGLLSFMQILEGESRLAPGLQDPYLMTHPLTTDRIAAIEDFVKHSQYTGVPEPEELQARHRRMVAKLRGYLDPPEQTFRRYPENDQSFAARYARAFAYYRKGDFPEAIRIINQLLAEKPNDPYLYEARGQFEFESGQLDKALVSYRKATDLLPHEDSFRVDLARVEIATGDKANLTDAIANLRAALITEPKRPFVWRQLAIALGQNGEIAESSLAQAEEAMLLNNKREAKYYAERAVAGLPPGSAARLKAEDILVAIRQEE